MTEVRSYYGRAVLKEPVWKREIPWYFFAGGSAGAAATLALAARIAGNEELRIAASRVDAAGVLVSPLLLVADLGRPERFLNMLRVFKVTSPMSVGSWTLLASGGASSTVLACDVLGILPRLRLLGTVVAGALGPFLSTYTAALVSDTAIPVWHEARRELPLVFAGSSAASGGALTAMFAPAGSGAPARRLAVGGALVELAATHRMEQRLGFLGEPYRTGKSGLYARLARGLTAAGAVVTAAAGRRRSRMLLGGALLCAGSACGRLAVFNAGFQSARDPKYTILQQRKEIERRAV